MADLELRGLRVGAGARELVRGVDLRVAPGELLGVVGASGSGKSLTARALLGLVPPELTVEAELTVPGTPPLRPYALVGRAREAAFRGLRGRVVGLLPQDAGLSLDPFRTVGAQLRRVGAGQDDGAVDRALRGAGFAEPAAVRDRYPHELSGGMAQRAALATLLITGCPFLVCDEPTTGLDAAVQRALMGTLSDLAQAGRGVVVVSHALRWLHRGADRVVVFADGQVVEEAQRGEPLTTEAGRRLAAAVHQSTTPGFPGSLPTTDSR